MELIRVNKEIYYLPASVKPLSADVVFIKSDDITYVFDVGANDESAEAINRIKGKKIVVISHFHKDHAFNVQRIQFNELYGGKETIKHTHIGIEVSKKTIFNSDIPIYIMPIPSSHSKGSLIFVYGDYAFLGDAAYAGVKDGKRVYNCYQLGEVIKTLTTIDVKYMGMSHYNNFIYDKNIVMKMLKANYSLRKSREDYIILS